MNLSKKTCQTTYIQYIHTVVCACVCVCVFMVVSKQSVICLSSIHTLIAIQSKIWTHFFNDSMPFQLVFCCPGASFCASCFRNCACCFRKCESSLTESWTVSPCCEMVQNDLTFGSSMFSIYLIWVKQR